MSGHSIPIQPPVNAATPVWQQYLSFFLAGQEYAVDILRVQEIREWGAVTPVPNTAPFVRGVMNLRGAVVPVIDLRLRMGLPEAPYSSQTVVIVIHVHAEDRTRIMGMVVDAVAEVYDLAVDQIRPPPEVTAQGLDNHVSGLIDIEGRMLTLLDFDRMFSIDAMVAPAGHEP